MRTCQQTGIINWETRDLAHPLPASPALGQSTDEVVQMGREEKENMEEKARYREEWMRREAKKVVPTWCLQSTNYLQVL